MRVILHPKVDEDVCEIMRFYEEVDSADLAEAFYQELKRALLITGERPHSFALRKGDFRRVNLPRFPYHFIFRIVEDAVRVLVVRHHHRRPSVGMRRK